MKLFLIESFLQKCNVDNKSLIEGKLGNSCFSHMGLLSINSPSFSERFVTVLSLAGFVFSTSREPAVHPGVEQQLNTYTRTPQSFLLALILDRQQNCVILIAYCVEALPCHTLLF